MGWNQLEVNGEWLRAGELSAGMERAVDDCQPNALMEGLGDKPYVYFVHSYYVPVCQETIATADYILPYSASMHRDNFYACQFHPEKSGKVGERILKNFLEIDG
jgi:glutamine amidotransferase